MALSLLNVSWRKWPDPIVDFGPQCYAAWRLSNGGSLYHDFAWNYGPFSIHVYSLLFKLFGPGIMVLAYGNLAVYLGITIVSYVLFRRAWGPIGAVTGLGVFISVFSFSHLSGVGNYNYVTPYSVETIHGMLVLLASIWIASNWSEEKSIPYATALGFFFGLALVIKPEFILAIAILSLAVFAIRWRGQKTISWIEIAAFLGASILPTLAFTLAFATRHGFQQGFIDAIQAWWLVLVDHVQSGDRQQSNFTGADNIVVNLFTEARATFCVCGIVGFLNLLGKYEKRRYLMIVCGVVCVPLFIWAGGFSDGWMGIGRCFPGLLALILVWKFVGTLGQNKNVGTALTARNTGVFILIAAMSMMARMILRCRITHFGYFQAALAGMSLSAMATSVLPGYFTKIRHGVNWIRIAIMLLLGFGCGSIIAKNLTIRFDQTEPVAAEGCDRFYSTIRNLNPSGALVNWAVNNLNKTSQSSTVMVFPEGMMINYLARRKSLEPGWMRGMTETQLIESMEKTPPDYIIFMSRDIREFGIKMFGSPGDLGFDIVKWAANRYSVVSGWGEDPLAMSGNVGIFIMKRNPSKKPNEVAKEAGKE